MDRSNEKIGLDRVGNARAVKLVRDRQLLDPVGDPASKTCPEVRRPAGGIFEDVVQQRSRQYVSVGYSELAREEAKDRDGMDHVRSTSILAGLVLVCVYRESERRKYAGEAGVLARGFSTSPHRVDPREESDSPRDKV